MVCGHTTDGDLLFLIVKSTRTRTGMAAVQNDDHMGVVGGHAGDQVRQLLVGQVPLARQAAVIAD